MPGPLRTPRATAAVLTALLVLSGCYSSRSSIPSEPQRTTEAEGRKARQEREAAEQKSTQAAAAKEAAAKAEAEKQVAAKLAAEKDAAEKLAAEKAAAEKQAAERQMAEKQMPEKQAEPAPVQQAAPTQAAAQVQQAAAAAAPTRIEVVKVEPGAAAGAQVAPSGDLVAPAQAEPNAPAATQSAPAAPAARQYFVQMGSFTSDKNAEGAVTWLKANGYESSRVVKVEQSAAAGPVTLHRVQAGPFQDLETAHKALEGLKANWPQAFIPAD